MMSKSLSGFSLIELMVVIAIVALLAAVATPSYMRYISNAKYASAYAASSSFFDRVKEYYSQNGIYPTSVADFGYTPQSGIPTDTQMPTSVSEFVIPPYVMLFSLAPFYPAAPGSCANFAVQTYISNVDTPFVAVSDGVLQVNNWVFEVSGVLRTICTYNYIENGTYVLNPNISLEGCLEESNPSSSAIISAKVSEINALCP